MVRLLSRSRMVAIVPSLEGRAPASGILHALDGAIFWLSDAGEFAGRDFYPVPWGEPALGSVGRKRVYSEGQADVKRNLGLPALKLSLRAPGFRREESAFQWMGKSRSLAALVMTNL